MKHIINYSNFISEKLILEVGEGSAKVYPYKVDDDFPTRDGAKYRDIRFETEDGDNYVVNLKAFWGPAIERDKAKPEPYFQVDFTTEDKYGLYDDADRVVNKGRLFKVMATVVKATREFINDIDYKEKDIKKMIVYPSKSKKSDHRRANLYMAYIKKHLPTSNIKYNGDRIDAKLK